MALVATLLLIHTFGTAYLQDRLLWTHTEDGGHRHQGVVSNGSYLIGVGKADITGPVVEINLMGYADPDQVGSGLRQRLYSRAFIIGSPLKPEERIVYVVQDVQSGDTAVRRGVLDGLKAMGQPYAMYGQQNVAITGTHSHSGPGAWLNYLLPQITSKGFDRGSYDAIVQGTLLSIKRAHESLQPGTLAHADIRLDDANVNRSPYAYQANPPEERSEYQDDVDKQMSLLAFRAQHQNKYLGILTWFPVHGTSMLGNNTLVTGDNKGVAADLFERYARKLQNSSPDFVAGFSQANVGDTSPNILGAWCESGPQRGQQCDFKTSLCAGKTQPCHGRGPHWGLHDAGTASTFEIGRRQYVAARTLFENMGRDQGIAKSVGTTAAPVVRSVHVFVNFANRTFVLPNGTEARTCPAALGYSFAAGTTDGPGAFDFKQHNSGEPNANPLWEAVRNQLHKPGSEQVACHGPKPILLDVGETQRPYLWTPNIVDLQFFRIGHFYIVISPGEATTMAGRRWRTAVANAVTAELGSESLDRPVVVLGGPSNSYTHYIATEEEYAIQRYEGASTLYGPYTLAAYLELTSKLVPYLSQHSITDQNSLVPPTSPSLPTLDPGPPPPIHTNVSLSFINPVIRDSPGFFKRFGDVVHNPGKTYVLQMDKPFSVEATFIAANPRNNVRLEESFVAVERFNEHTGVWSLYRDDSDWSTVLEWERTNTIVGTSTAKVRWELGWEFGTWHEFSAADKGAESHTQRGSFIPEDASQRRTSAHADYHPADVPTSPTEILDDAICGFPDDLASVEGLRGLYRLRYRGDAKSIGGHIENFEGLSSEFELV
ncbi:Hypothetical protein D9617_17g045820 [Elsinoe fawcettii]|nr:Hypothetical protein D9617_17g045820 [Elsinoe fawcettii]